MACFGFTAPSDWANCRNLDLPVQLDDINIDNVDDEEDEDPTPSPAVPPKDKDAEKPAN